MNYPNSSSATPHTLVMKHTSNSNVGMRSARWTATAKVIPSFSSNYQIAADLFCIDHSFTKEGTVGINRATSSA